MTTVSAGASATVPSTIEENSRQFPCPECSPLVPQERLAVLEFHTVMNSSVRDPDYIEAGKHDAARQLALSLLRGGFIRFELGPDDLHTLQFALRATVGVVSPVAIASLEQRALLKLRAAR